MGKKYIIGLDIGTTSVGWAVVNEAFDIARSKKTIIEIDTKNNAMKRKSRTNLWGVRLFDEGTVAADRRMKRGMRRRIERRKRRLMYLRDIFQEHILSFDDSFFIRMTESFFQNDDDIKTVKTQYPLFNGRQGAGETYQNEVEYYDNYPTIYHLRTRLVENPKQADLRLVYLALHHILKFRGHFLNEGQEFNLEDIDLAKSLLELLHQYEVSRQGSFEFNFDDDKHDDANEILLDRKRSRSKKAFDLADLFSVKKIDQYYDKYDQGTSKKTDKFLETIDSQLKALFAAIVGNGIDLAKIFDKEAFKPSEDNDFEKAGDFKYSKEDFEEKLLKIENELELEELEVIQTGKRVYEAILLSGILTKDTLSASMVDRFDKHKGQLVELKRFTKSVSYKLFASFFKDGGIYSKYIDGEGNPKKHTSREDFYKATKDALKDYPEFLKLIEQDIELETYLLKQRTSDNAAIPYQVHEHELVKILENQGQYYPFLLDKHEKQAEYKIRQLFKFRIPYYIGTLAKQAGWQRNENGELVKVDAAFAKNAWVVRKSGEKLTPWNFDDVIDKEQSAANFIERMTNFCTYLPHEKVLPKHSLLYQEFTIYNELITSGYFENGRKLPFNSELRQKIVSDLFKKHKKITATKMLEFLNHELCINLQSTKELFGIDTVMKSPSFNTSYSSYLDLLSAGISNVEIEDNRERFEQIIKWQTIFDDKKILKKTIRAANAKVWNGFLSEEQIDMLSKKKYTGWGRLSKRLLDGILANNGKTIIQNLKEEPFRNFMQLLEDSKINEEIKYAQVEGIESQSLSNYELVASLTGSPALKKGIWQCLKIINELESHLGRENIDKIVLEMAREEGSGGTKTRQRQIEEFHKKFSEKTGQEIDQHLRSDFAYINDPKEFDKEKVFLYFLQNGKCMYSGQSLNLDDLSTYEVDHIVPQTYIKDDSFDNKVLVTKKANQDKGGDVPGKTIEARMINFWELLAKNGQVSMRKLANLKRPSLHNMDEITEEGFIKRQLVETRQITKHVANILSDYFRDTDIEILTPKAGLIGQFRDGIIYKEKSAFDEKEAIINHLHFEMDGVEYLPSGETKESKYSNANFVKIHFHEGYKKLRDLNDYHHAHDAYLSVVVANYVYRTRPDLKKMWVYGQYLRNADKEQGKYGTQRQKFQKQLLTGMADENWVCYNIETGEVFDMLGSRDEILSKIKRNLGLRNVNVTKKTEMQLGKFGDESVYQKDPSARNFAAGIKKNLDPARYGGTKAPVSAFAIIARNIRGEIKALSVPTMLAGEYLNAENKLLFLQELYSSENVCEVLVERLSKYVRYNRADGAPRVLASYQEAGSGTQLPMMKLGSESMSKDELLSVFDQLSAFITKNKLFANAKLLLLQTVMRENFKNLDTETQTKAIAEMLRVTKGSNQGLRTLSALGLGTTAQQLKSGNLIESGTTLIHQSPTGLYEVRKTL